jgi:hypothetical protein
LIENVCQKVTKMVCPIFLLQQIGVEFQCSMY